MKILISLSFMLISYYSLAMSDTEAFFTFNGKETAMIKKAVPTNIEVYFKDKHSNEMEKDFKIMHGKIMHMVIYKHDLSVFKHVHPYFDPITGRFQVTINMPHSDPDNFDLTDTIIEPGMYMVMADVDIKGKGMRMGHSHLHVMGDSKHSMLIADPIDANGVIHKIFNTKFKVALDWQETHGCKARLIDFNLSLTDLDSNPVDIQPWLQTGGHSVVISQTNKNPQSNKLSFGHMHAPEPLDKKSFIFSYYDQSTLSKGLNKIWFQIKVQNKVLTIPFVFNLNRMSQNDEC